MKNLYIFGCGVTGRSIYKFVTDYNLFEIKGFIIDDKYYNDTEYCNLPVFKLSSLPSDFDIKEDYIFVALEWDRLNAVRRSVYERLKKQGFRFANIISPKAVVHSEIKGDNCWLSDYVVIENDVTIEDDVYIKTRATVAHMTHIGSHCFIGANSFTAGGCRIGAQTYLGICSTIFNSTIIGEKCLVGACVYVKRNLPDFSVIKTTNEEFIVKTYREDEIENKLQANIRIR